MKDEVALKRLCDRWGDYGLNISSDEYTEEGVRFIRTSDITDDGHLIPAEEGVCVAADVARDHMLQDGDILFSRSGTVGRSLVYREQAHGPCSFAAYLVRFRLRPEVDPRFVYYFSKSVPFWDQIELEATQSTISNFNAQKYGSLRVPSRPSQTRGLVADFLDRETARIDDLLDRKGRLLDSLYERRRSLTADAILGGSDAVRALSGSVRGRDETEEPWLDVFPFGWHRCRLRNLVSEIKNGTWGNEPEPENEGVVCVRAADFDRLRNRVSREKLVRRSVSAGELVKHRLDPGDLVLEKSGGGDQQPVGAAVLYDLPEPAVATNFAARLRPAPDVDSRYLNYVLAVVYDLGLNRRSIKQTTGIQNLDTRAFFSEPWAVPPYDEQVAISDRLDRATSLLDRIMDKQKRAVELFQERRQALITAAVTGEIDVPVSAA